MGDAHVSCPNAGRPEAGRALASIVDPVIAYNIVVLLTFPLSALSTYLLARHLSLPHFGSMVAGLAYAFLPFHVMQAGGHPHIAQTPMFRACARFGIVVGLMTALLAGGGAPVGAVTRISRDDVINVSAGGGSVPTFVV